MKSPSGIGAGRTHTIDGDLHPCWLCRRSVAARALFCHGCGSVQPPRPLDHFTRLGLPRRFDLDLAALNRQYIGFRRALASERFASRGTRERAHAHGQSEAFALAYETLKEPVRRARYLLELTGGEPEPSAADAGLEAEMAALLDELSRAADTVTIDRLASQAGRDIEGCILQLSAAFRAGDLGVAAAALVRLEQLEALADEARSRRAACPGPGGEAPLG